MTLKKSASVTSMTKYASAKVLARIKPTDYDSGYLMGLNIAIKMINLQPESGIGQVTFNFDSNG